MIQQEQARSDLSIEALGEVLDVSASGYYAWCERDISLRLQADVRLGDEIEQVFVESRRTYGSQRVWLGLCERGIRTSRKRVARLMRQRGLRSIRARKRRMGLTKAGQSAYFAPNQLQQDFNAPRKNEKWVADTTYIPTREGWLYLVSVMDLFSRQVVGWAMDEQHDANLATSALDWCFAISVQKWSDYSLVLLPGWQRKAALHEESEIVATLRTASSVRSALEPGCISPAPVRHHPSAMPSCRLA
jgi:putative transposase